MTWTKDEMRRFDELTKMASSQDQMDRIHARLELPKFIKEHGEEKCDAMFKELTK